jgi:ribosomal protein S18 acetylase RimI-like enzyme
VEEAVADVPRDVAISALEGNLWDMWSAFGRGTDCKLVDTAELLRFETPLPYIPYNSVMKTRLRGDVNSKIDQILAAYVERDVPLMWVVHPSVTPPDLSQRLEARGLVEAEVCPGMIAPIDGVPSPDDSRRDLGVERLGIDARDDFFELVAWRYSLPAAAAATLLSIMRARHFGEPECPTQAWVVRRQGHVVSKVILHLTGDVAGIYGVATRPEARGEGLAEHLTATALAFARRHGARLAILHSTPRAQPLYERLGFTAVADFRLFSTPGTLHL